MSKIHQDMMRLIKQMENPFLRSIDLQLVRMLALMQALGRPDKKFPPVVHVAGTNGKGSLIAYLRAMIEQSGKSAHVYTSPHLVRFNERVVVNGKEADDAELYDALRKVQLLSQQFPATLFEGVTAAAFLIFAKHKADILLLEVGMGGRLDATNVVEKPYVTVITPISIDHSEYLGNDVAVIAKEKAGIIKKGVPCVVGPQEASAMAVITERAQQVGAPLYRLGHEWHVDEENGQYIYRSAKRRVVLPKPSLAGQHQWFNAATAVAVMDVLHELHGFEWSEEGITKGIENTAWTGRLQPLFGEKWTKHLPLGSEVWLDGGHNPGAAKVLAGWAKEQVSNGRKMHLVCGMLKAKDARGFLEYLMPFTTTFWAVPIHDEPNAILPGELEYKVQQMGIPATCAHHVPEAIERIGKEAGGEPVCVLITGSLYLVGQVLAQQEV